jgi:RNA ligase
MRYKFPIIRTIDDVLPHIAGRDEFIVAQREGYSVINYVVSMSNTFDMTGPDDLGGAIRRECRGLIFYPDGRLMSRPFHKFFNVNEREETQQHIVELDLKFDHELMEKMDGSMIRPVYVNGCIRLGTKMGVTEVAMAAETYLAGRPDSGEIMNWMLRCVKAGITPIFEFVAPNNQIVIPYEQADLVLLAMRVNETGGYLADQNSTPAGITRVPVYGSVQGNLADYISRAREREGREGDIVRFADGHMLKIKNDWYVRIHKTMDRVRFDRHIVELILNEQLDDAIGMLPVIEADRIRKFEADFWYAFQHTEHQLEMLVQIAKEQYDGDRKRVALEFIPILERKDSAAFIFGSLLGRDMREQMLNHVKKYVSSNTRWAECAKWLGMENVSELEEVDE